MIKDISLSASVVNLESVLKLEYEEQRNTRNTIDNAKHNLENTYGVVLDKGVYDVQAENQLSAENLDRFLNELSQALKQLALYTSIAIFNKSIPISLANVNYLGLASEDLITYLRYLMDKDLYIEHRHEIMPLIMNSLDKIHLNTIKRLFTILLFLDDLEIFEGVTVIAQLLFLGGFNV